ncbi:MAG: hypothetical protein WAM60_09685 [Candidatus Promineifilaceae bacterium]
MKTLKENLLIGHHIGLCTSITFGLLLVLFSTSTSPVGWLTAVPLMYIVAAGLTAAAPYLFGEEMMAAATAAMGGLSPRVFFVPQPTVVFQQAPQAAIVGHPPRFQSLVWVEQSWLSTNPAIVIKTAVPFLLFGQAPLRIP